MTSKRLQIVRLVQNEIISGNFQPGQRLTERTIGELSGASRSSVREAFNLLEQEGYVTNKSNKGVRVSILDTQEASDIYQVRSALEGLAAKNFINFATAEQRKDLDQSLISLKEAIDAGNVKLQLKAIETFYETLLNGCCNAVLKSTLQGLHGKIARLRATSILSPGRIQNSLKEMSRINEAIQSNDENEAWQAAMDHMRKTSEIALRVINYLDDRQNPLSSSLT